MPIPAVILAAGESVRLGRPKQLIEFAGETLLNRTLRLAHEAGVDPVIAVLGAHLDPIRPTLPPQTQIIHNAEWQTGMASSIRAGIRALDASAPGVLILTCDQPRLTADHLRALLAAFSGDPSAIAASRYSGKRGTPVIWPRSLFPALLALEGDKGARTILAQPPCALVEIDFPGGDVDIDLPGDLTQLGVPS
ncbi:MAG: NTP transferase domain-containing protein [Acidobacteriota bacterium]